MKQTIKLIYINGWIYIEADFNMIQNYIKQFFACQYDTKLKHYRFKINYLKLFYEDYNKNFNIIINEEISKQYNNFLNFYNNSEKVKNINIDNYYQYCNEKFPLVDLQKQGAIWLSFVQKGILSFGTGVGKTFTSLEAVHFIHNEKPHLNKVLIITLNSIIKQWQNEIGKAFPNLKIFNACSSNNRIQIYKDFKACDDFSCLVINYEKVRIDLEYLDMMKFDYIIIDEASKLKSLGRTTGNGNLNNRFSVKKLCDKVNYVFALTATPIETSYYNLFGIFQVINDNVFCGGLSRFRERYFDMNYYGDQILFKEEKLSELKDIVKPYIFFKEVDLGVKSNIHKIELNFYEEDYKNYNKILEDKMNAYLEQHPFPGDISNQDELLEYKKKVKEQMQFETTNNKFQFCDFPSIVYEDLYSETYSPKMKWILDNVEKFNDKTIIFDSRTKTTDKICKSFDENNIKYYLITGDIKQKQRNEIIEEYQNQNEIKFLICSDCLSFGANLQFCSNMIHFNMNFTGAGMKQRTGRIIRRGQKSKVNIYMLVMKHTIEDNIYKKINSRIKSADEILTFSLKQRDLLEFISN